MTYPSAPSFSLNWRGEEGGLRNVNISSETSLLPMKVLRVIFQLIKMCLRWNMTPSTFKGKREKNDF